MGTQPISIKPVNECAIVTLFPMTAICNTNNPSTPQSYDGAISLMISGGTPPYNITWEEGGLGPTKSNLGVGDYHATIVDFYGNDLFLKLFNSIVPLDFYNSYLIKTHESN